MLLIAGSKKKFFKTPWKNENGNTTCQNLWEVKKIAILRWNSVINAYIFLKSQKKSKKNLNSHLKKPEKEQMKPKFSRREKLTKIRVKINLRDWKRQ